MDGAFSLTRMHWRTMLPIVFVLVAPFAFTQAFLTRDLPTIAEQFRRIQEGTNVANPYSDYSGSFWVTWVIQYLVVTPMITSALLRVLIGGSLGEVWTAGEAVRSIGRLIGPLVWAFALVTSSTFGLQVLSAVITSQATQARDAIWGLGVLLGIVGLVFAFIFAFRLLFVGPAVVIEGHKGFPALQRSWWLSIGSFWKLVGNLIVVSLVTAVPLGLLAFAPQQIARANDGAWWLVAGLGMTIALSITTPFLTSANTLLYLHCRVVKESLTLEQLEQQVGDRDEEARHVLPPPPNG